MALLPPGRDLAPGSRVRCDIARRAVRIPSRIQIRSRLRCRQPFSLRAYFIGLEVSVDQADAMRREQPLAGGQKNPQDLFLRSSWLPLPGRQRAAFDIFHCQEYLTIDFPYFVRMPNVGMGNLGHSLCFSQNASPLTGSLKLSPMQHLDSHLAV